jgi:hypothetical protein
MFSLETERKRKRRTKKFPTKQQVFLGPESKEKGSIPP